RFLRCSPPHRALPSFPTRRSSDLCCDRHSCESASNDHAWVPTGSGCALAAMSGVPAAGALIAWGEGDQRAGEQQADQCHTRHLRSEEHTSELQSLAYLVCRLLLEK